ncbi:hypothetical protein WBG78_03560 [Chryseolinea sp. T2]|uniref:hypothetical protein n=1 Tax=Chryseolinea sp. T2 TaxID=3129255 RepID=UPI00307701B8
MRKLPFVVLFIVIMTAVGSNAFGQRKSPQKTRGAKAAYGEPLDVWQSKKKAKRSSKKAKRKAAKKKDAAPLNRNRNKSPWVN